MKHKSLIVQSLFFVVLLTIFASCNSSKYAAGFSYKSKDPGMDIGSSGYTAPVGTTTLVTEETDLNNNSNAAETLSDDHIKISSSENEKFSMVRSMVIEEYQKQKMQREAMANPAPIRSSEIIANVTAQMEEKGMIHDVSEKKLHKIEKLADKWDKKNQKHAKEGFLGEGVDLFLAIMAIAGLAVALIFGTFIGVVIFLVFGGVWLYRKLVQ